MITARAAALAAALCFGAASLALAQTATTPSVDRTTDQGTGAASGTSSAMTKSEMDAQKVLENQGYSHVQDVKSTPEGISAKAKKDGQDVDLTIDSSGKVREK